MQNQRLENLKQFAASHFPLQQQKWQMVSGDASFRRYFRYQGIHPECGEKISVIAVDAPPVHENNSGFIHIANHMNLFDLRAPEILAQDLESGYLLITDFGDLCLLDILNEENVEKWYQQGFVEILKIQRMGPIHHYQLPEYSVELLMYEMNLMPQWFLQTHLNFTLDSILSRLQDLFSQLVTLARKQPQTKVHLDFHSRNLMVLEDQHLGILDFQDMNLGPVCYDLISLIKDCYIKWPQHKIEKWMLEFKAMNEVLSEVSNDEFIFWADMMSIQRHLKVLGIFSRLNYRDGKSGYLADIPRVLTYIEESLEKHNTHSWLVDLIRNHWKPQSIQNNLSVLD